MYNGVINVYKEKGYTSHDVVAKMRGILKQKKIGHTGTLDPDAEGVLPVCLGHGTKLSDLLTDQSKSYQTVLLLGTTTDTQDLTGQVLKQYPVNVSEQQVNQVTGEFIGEYLQIPPMYSALKINGKKLYELARQGKVVERKPRSVEILDLVISSIQLPRITMDVTCSKGTYIRTLCEDIGNQLGCGGCMESLKRTRVERFCITDSLRLAEIETLRDSGQLDAYITPVDQIFGDHLQVSTANDFDCLIYNGNSVRAEQLSVALVLSVGQLVRMYDSKEQFIGLYEYQEGGIYKPRKMFLGR